MRAVAASIEVVDSDTDLVAHSDYILSIVPPRDALDTAKRFATASQSASSRAEPIYYIDLNAVSPRLSREIAAIFTDTPVRLIDGAIIGGPPSCEDPQQAHDAGWTVPRMPMSGPHARASCPADGAELARGLNAQHISETIGAASGLKLCFASLTKGFSALVIQSLTTAKRLGVLAELKEALEGQAPAQAKLAKRVTNVPPKAYRWVREMEEIADTHADDGGFGENERIFDAIAAVFKTVAEDTVLGEEISEKRKRGMTGEDVAACMIEGLDKRKGGKP